MKYVSCITYVSKSLITPIFDIRYMTRLCDSAYNSQHFSMWNTLKVSPKFALNWARSKTQLNRSAWVCDGTAWADLQPMRMRCTLMPQWRHARVEEHKVLSWLPALAGTMLPRCVASPCERAGWDSLQARWWAWSLFGLTDFSYCVLLGLYSWKFSCL